MRWIAPLKIAGFVAGCVVWLIAGLTLLGPLVRMRACPDSDPSACGIAGNLWAELIEPNTLLDAVMILVAGLVLVGIGALLWRGVGRTGRIVMGISFAVGALSLAVVANAAYDHWLPAAILLVALGKAIAVAALWIRAHPG